ncbi:hypothetical protein X798_02550 [Onchocerca flexuosa]|uniref:KH domain-containing protein n=2 Tax=Onchocerca flexuosa TaxID=387005 RepID=A0A183HFT0_9BILA|nr:hypothetical protein X798_02550 [Onchocerca flexuosa]VDO46255.1 unnamed protein product [Onchocerca flexuosa]
MDGIEESGDTGQPPEQNIPNASSLTPKVSKVPKVRDASPEHLNRDGPYDSARYLDELIKDMRMLDSIQIEHPHSLRHTYALLTTEIDRIWNLIYSRTLRDEQMLTYHHSRITIGDIRNRPYMPMSFTMKGPLITIQEKIMIPERPDCKLIGRILGPRGISVKQLEAQTECRILIRGRGSVKDARREARLRNRIGWEHLSEPLHVLIIATDYSHDRCAQKLTNGIYNIKALLSSNDDEHKRRQLVQLAIINGSYRADPY